MNFNISGKFPGSVKNVFVFVLLCVIARDLLVTLVIQDLMEEKAIG